MSFLIRQKKIIVIIATFVLLIILIATIIDDIRIRKKKKKEKNHEEILAYATSVWNHAGISEKDIADNTATISYSHIKEQEYLNRLFAMIDEELNHIKKFC